MRLIKQNGGGPASPSILIDDRIVLIGLFMLLFPLWGKNSFQGQGYMFVIIGMMAYAFAMGRPILTVFGIYLSCWFTYFLSAGFNNVVPQEILVQAIDAITFVFAGMGLYVLVRNGKKPIETYLNWAICPAAIFLGILGVIQWKFGMIAAGATLGNPNFLAAFIAISLPLFFRPKWWFFIPLFIFILFVCRTSTAISAAFIASGWYFFGWKGVGLATIPAIVYYLIFKATTSTYIRFGYWTDALTKISNSWQTLVFGVGPGVYWQWQNELHSEYVYLLFNLGIIGFLIVAAYIAKSLRTVGDRRLYASFLAILVDAVGNHVMHVMPTAYLIIVILALRDRTAGREDIGRALT